MKKIALMMFITLLASSLMAEIRFVKSKNGKDITLSKLTKELKKYDVIFVGEEHGNQTVHRFQRELLPLIYQPKKKLIVSFEMWERDTQEIVDDFLAGKIPENDFIEKSRVWGNYKDYRPLLIFAKERGLPVVAANVPREYAGMVARQGLGFIEALDEGERSMIAQKIHAPNDEYRAEFYNTMQKMGGHSFDEASLQRYYEAQCIKDDTMAESIVIALDYYKKRPLIHFNGAYHSRAFLGTVARLQAALPRLKIAVLTPVFTEDWQELIPNKELLSLGTYLLLTDKPKKEAEHDS